MAVAIRHKSAGRRTGRIRPLRDALCASLAMLVAATISISLLYYKSREAYTGTVHQGLTRLAEVIAAQVDGDLHATLTDPAQEKTADYDRAVAPMRRALENVPGLRFVYTVGSINGHLHFILDATPPGDADHDGVEDHSALMDAYDAPDAAMQHSLQTGEPGCTNGVVVDAWGRLLSGYAPVRDSAGRQVAVLGVDITAAQYERDLASIHRAALWGFLPAVLVSVATFFGVNWRSRTALRSADRQALAERRLRDGERRLEFALEGSRDGLWDWHIASDLVYGNDRLHAMFGGAAEQAPRTFAEYRTLIHPADVERVTRRMEAHQHGDTPHYEAEYRVRNASGAWMWVLSRGKVVERDADGRALRMTGTLRDITERKHVESRLLRAALVLDSISEAVVVLDRQGAVVDWNRGAAVIFGQPREFAVGRRIVDVLGQPHSAPLDEAIARVADHQPWFGELDLIHETGEPIACDVTLLHMRDASDAGANILLVARDVTHRNRAEQELRAHTLALHSANAELRSQREELRAQQLLLEAMNSKLREAADATSQANAAKSAFLANMSHEIRTPITAMLGFADLVDEELGEFCCEEHACANNVGQCRDYVATIRRSGDHLLGIVSDILDLSKIEAGRMTIERVETPLIALVDDVVQTLNARAAARRLTITPDYRFPLPARIVTDPVRLRQILVNLVGNAIKFTEHGGVRIDISLATTPSGRRMLRFEVADTGVGMTAEQCTRLFQPFTQADVSTTRRFGGTGLGLAICRSLVELLGGQIDVRSTLGVGSVFVFDIDPGPLSDADLIDAPARPAPENAAERTDAAAPPLRGRVLLVEDGPDNRRLLSLLLTRMGVAPDIAENGLMGCERVAQAIAEERPYDLILMDMQMPVMDGYLATQRLRAEGVVQPIVALTAHALSTDAARCLSAGCSAYLTKPINRARLREALEQFLGYAHAPNGGEALPPTDPRADA